MQEYGREHLHELSVELMVEYLHSIVHILSQGAGTSSEIPALQQPTSTADVPVKVEKMLKEYKSHRSASDFARAFITSSAESILRSRSNHAQRRSTLSGR
mmetsp:Transcript_10581/g.15267  ORF Transcript_10581/g.15267 Transcript_10581/m.15267 type:complete len:100 (+) Transcript_10581:540-839(+)